jgi:hypothetical protein
VAADSVYKFVKWELLTMTLIFFLSFVFALFLGTKQTLQVPEGEILRLEFGNTGTSQPGALYVSGCLICTGYMFSCAQVVLLMRGMLHTDVTYLKQQAGVEGWQSCWLSGRGD